MSTVVSIASRSKSVAITDEQIGSLVDEIPGMRRDDETLLWSSNGGREVYFNLEPNELWSDAIESDEEYELVERIADCLGFNVFVDGELIEDRTEVSADKQGCGTACFVIAILVIALVAKSAT